jgi:putative transposase
VGRATLFKKETDYAAFIKVLRQAKERQPMRLLSFCLMPNHWHLVLWAKDDGESLRLWPAGHWLTLPASAG